VTIAQSYERGTFFLMATRTSDDTGSGAHLASDEPSRREQRRERKRERRDVARSRPRPRILPRSALGLATLLFFMAIAAAFSGAVLFAYYTYRLGETEERVEEFESGFADAVNEAKAIIERERDAAMLQVRAQLDELEKFSASGATLSSLLAQAQPAVWFVSTLDENGQPSVGSAFVAFADAEKSFLLTSYNTIRAATRSPAPEIKVRKGEEELTATLNGWDAGNDLALLVIPKANLKPLPWAEGSPPAVVGDRVFVVSGLGAAGGAISQGFVADLSGNGIQHDAPVGAAFQGGPLLNSQGQVLGVASRAYSPLGFAPEAVFFAIPIRNACTEVVRCPG
jgi:S1-C subfamily serine protease